MSSNKRQANNSRLWIALISLTAALTTVSCRHWNYQHTTAWPGYGEAKPGRIRVSVLGGDVDHRGVYFLESNVDLETANDICGRWQNQRMPRMEILRKVNGEGRAYRFDLRKMSKKARKAVKLQDGDFLIYPRYPRF